MNNNFSVEPQNNIVTPGQRLRQAREALGISQEDIARRLFLNKSIIKAIEEDNYDDIVAKTYARGYLRAYAQMLNLSEKEILAGFDQLKKDFVPYDTPVKPERYENAGISSSYGHKKTRWLSYGVIFVLILLVFVWSFNRHSGTEVKTISPQTNTSLTPSEAVTTDTTKLGNVIALPTTDQVIDSAQQISDQAKIKDNSSLPPAVDVGQSQEASGVQDQSTNDKSKSSKEDVKKNHSAKKQHVSEDDLSASSDDE